MVVMQSEYATRLQAGEGAALAEELGLERIGVRPKLGAYLKSLWSRRQFVWTMATSNAYARNRNNYLGQGWNILNPLLWAAVYFSVFGVLLGTRRDVENFLAFLIIGVFLFRFVGSTFTGGSKAISGNLSLVRSLNFPRAVLPISNTLTEFIILMPAVAVMCLIVGLSGFVYDDVDDGLRWSWLLLPVAILLLYLFCTGFALLIARLVADVRDLANLLPFISRLLFYLSGVFFSIEVRFGEALGPLLPYAEHQPVAIYLYLARSSMLDEFPFDGTKWLFGVGWAMLFLIGGFLMFWRAEERYGRD
jgi:teichoic acid transport system permease protein